MRDSSNQPLLIEVLRYVHGASNEELQEPTYTFRVEETIVRAPGPIALLRAKAANVADLSQVGRQDVRHVHILARLIPRYLKDLQHAAENARLTERQLIVMLERLLAILQDGKTRQVLADLKIDSRTLFSELSGSELPKRNRFLGERLSRFFAA